MSQSHRNKSDLNKSDTLTAVALQDHLIRKLNVNLSLSDPIGSRKLGQKLAYKKPKGKSVIDTHRTNIKPTQARIKKEQEYVLDPKPPPPTLAQRLGLVDQPKQLLNEAEWRTAKAKALDRQDFNQPCVICKEDIGKLCHVLLSCTHVFHKNCLQAFERFTGKKSCPMCRKEQYQTRVVHEGSQSYKHKCAVRIQAAWRGHVVRIWYLQLRKTIPPKDPKLRTKFFEEKLHTITDRMVRSMDMQVNSFLYEIDRNLEASRNIFQQFEIQQRSITADEWTIIRLKATDRQSKECPICLVEFDGVKKTNLTSCSHVFHETCLKTFETLAETDSSNYCPVCRSVYQKCTI